MENTTLLPTGMLAERIVRHFQNEGFAGISEALILRIRLRQGDRQEVAAAFEAAQGEGSLPPVHEWFEIRAVGHFSEFRSFAEARAAIQKDFTASLRHGLPEVFFDAPPVMVHDPLATGARYDALVKLSENREGYAFAILLNDPEASFLDYLGTRHGTDWHRFLGDFEGAAIAFAQESDLL